MPENPDDYPENYFESHPDEHPDRMPTVNHPLNGPRRKTLQPLLLTVAVFAVLITLYLVATKVLVDAG